MPYRERAPPSGKLSAMPSAEAPGSFCASKSSKRVSVSRYAREFRANGPTDFSAVTTTGYRELYADGISGEARTALALEQFGECVARADAVGVQTFLRQGPGSSGERAAIQALVPRYAACIPRHETITFSLTVLKGALAEGIYRLSVAARDAQQAAR